MADFNYSNTARGAVLVTTAADGTTTVVDLGRDVTVSVTTAKGRPAPAQAYSGNSAAAAAAALSNRLQANGASA